MDQVDRSGELILDKFGLASGADGFFFFLFLEVGREGDAVEEAFGGETRDHPLIEGHSFEEGVVAFDVQLQQGLEHSQAAADFTVDAINLVYF